MRAHYAIGDIAGDRSSRMLMQAVAATDNLIKGSQTPAKMAGRDSNASIHLDAARGIAALAVFLGHLRALFFVDFEELRHQGTLTKAIYLVTGFGHAAVIVFFILSGYLI